jgi:hypothetical protein
MSRINYGLACVFLSGALLLCLPRAKAAVPHIDDLSPQSGSAGTNVTLDGSGFTGTSTAMFTARVSGAQVNGGFAVTNDTLMDATVPGGVGSSWLVSLFNPDGATVTIFPGYFNITGPSGSLGGSSTYVVRSGGSLSGGFGSSTIFIESGGGYQNLGGGSNTIYVQNGGTCTSSGSGGNLAFAEPGAIVVGGITATAEPALAESFIPEPTGLALILFSPLLLMRRRGCPGSGGE